MMGPSPRSISMSRGRLIDVSGPRYYQDTLTGIVDEILYELSGIETLNLAALEPGDFDQLVTITQIRLLNELYFCLGQLRAQGVDQEVPQAIQDLRGIWNRYIDETHRPQALKFQVDPRDMQVQ